MSNPLFDIEFLTELSKHYSKETFARITALSWDESPLERIEGQITAGTVNIDGSSAVRRTCSLSLVAKNVNINNYYWGLQTKFKLEIGIKNTINNTYPDTIWFPQGIFIITAFNTQMSVNNYTISISGKDKMCMLNGDLGGSLNASIDFGVEEYWDKNANIIYYNKVPIKTIIKNAVHVYGNEPLHNIIITDIDDYGVELLEYRGDESTPLFLFREADSDIYINMSLNRTQPCWVKQSDGTWEKATIDTIEEKNGKYDIRINATTSVDGTEIKIINTESATRYKIHKMVYGDTVGYRLTEVVYAGDLISKVGESLTSILDKIKTMLGDFEYFYDIQGRFVFQKKKTYITNDWNSIVKREDDMYVESAAYTSTSVYTFSDSHYFTTLSHTPTLNNLKNDFSVWGNRKSVSGANIPIHMRYAVDRKPTKYTNYEGRTFFSEDIDWSFYPDIQIKKTDLVCDWREIIYQMALDYFAHQEEDFFLFTIGRLNSEDYPLGYTGYEIYYTDLQGFWRQLYNPNIFNSLDNKDINPVYGKQYYYIDEKNRYISVNFEDAVNLLSPSIGEDYYALENGKYIKYIADENFKFYYGENYYQYNEESEEYSLINIYTFNLSKVYYWQEDEYCDINNHWNLDVHNNPAVLNFWFDFIGEGSNLDKYMVCNIGDRSKSINDSKVTGIYFEETPTVLFITNEEYAAMAENPIKTGYTYIRINDTLLNFFSISAQGKSAQDVIETLLYENTYCAENISLTSIPIYHLDANTRIEVNDRESNIEGEYLISKITLPLTYNGTMSITASKAVDTIY